MNIRHKALIPLWCTACAAIAASYGCAAPDGAQQHSVASDAAVVESEQELFRIEFFRAYESARDSLDKSAKRLAERHFAMEEGEIDMQEWANTLDDFSNSLLQMHALYGREYNLFEFLMRMKIRQGDPDARKVWPPLRVHWPEAEREIFSDKMWSRNGKDETDCQASE